MEDTAFFSPALSPKSTLRWLHENKTQVETPAVLRQANADQLTDYTLKEGSSAMSAEEKLNHINIQEDDNTYGDLSLFNNSNDSAAKKSSFHNINQGNRSRLTVSSTSLTAATISQFSHADDSVEEALRKVLGLRKRKIQANVTNKLGQSKKMKVLSKAGVSEAGIISENVTLIPEDSYRESNSPSDVSLQSIEKNIRKKKVGKRRKSIKLKFDAIVHSMASSQSPRQGYSSSDSDKQVRLLNSPRRSQRVNASPRSVKGSKDSDTPSASLKSRNKSMLTDDSDIDSELFVRKSRYNLEHSAHNKSSSSAVLQIRSSESTTNTKSYSLPGKKIKDASASENETLQSDGTYQEHDSETDSVLDAVNNNAKLFGKKRKSIHLQMDSVIQGIGQLKSPVKQVSNDNASYSDISKLEFNNTLTDIRTDSINIPAEFPQSPRRSQRMLKSSTSLVQENEHTDPSLLHSDSRKSTSEDHDVAASGNITVNDSNPKFQLNSGQSTKKTTSPDTSLAHPGNLGTSRAHTRNSSLHKESNSPTMANTSGGSDVTVNNMTLPPDGTYEDPDSRNDTSLEIGEKKFAMKRKSVNLNMDLIMQDIAQSKGLRNTNSRSSSANVSGSQVSNSSQVIHTRYASLHKESNSPTMANTSGGSDVTVNNMTHPPDGTYEDPDSRNDKSLEIGEKKFAMKRKSVNLNFDLVMEDIAQSKGLRNTNSRNSSANVSGSQVSNSYQVILDQEHVTKAQEKLKSGNNSENCASFDTSSSSKRMNPPESPRRSQRLNTSLVNSRGYTDTSLSPRNSRAKRSEEQDQIVLGRARESASRHSPFKSSSELHQQSLIAFAASQPESSNTSRTTVVARTSPPTHVIDSPSKNLRSANQHALHVSSVEGSGHLDNTYDRSAEGNESAFDINIKRSAFSRRKSVAVNLREVYAELQTGNQSTDLAQTREKLQDSENSSASSDVNAKMTSKKKKKSFKRNFDTSSMTSDGTYEETDSRSETSLEAVGKKFGMKRKYVNLNLESIMQDIAQSKGLRQIGSNSSTSNLAGVSGDVSDKLDFVSSSGSTVSNLVQKQLMNSAVGSVVGEMQEPLNKSQQSGDGYQHKSSSKKNADRSTQAILSSTSKPEIHDSSVHNLSDLSAQNKKLNLASPKQASFNTSPTRGQRRSPHKSVSGGAVESQLTSSGQSTSVAFVAMNEDSSENDVDLTVGSNTSKTTKSLANDEATSSGIRPNAKTTPIKKQSQVKNTKQLTMKEFLARLSQGKIEPEPIKEKPFTALLNSVLQKSNGKNPLTSKKTGTNAKAKGRTAVSKRQPRLKTFSPLINKRVFQHYSRHKVSREAMQAVQEVTEKWFSNFFQDISVILNVKKTDTITEKHMYLLLKQLKIVKSEPEYHAFLQEMLPTSEWEKVIPMAFPYNVIKPKSSLSKG